MLSRQGREHSASSSSRILSIATASWSSEELGFRERVLERRTPWPFFPAEHDKLASWTTWDIVQSPTTLVFTNIVAAFTRYSF